MLLTNLGRYNPEIRKCGVCVTQPLSPRVEVPPSVLPLSEPSGTWRDESGSIEKVSHRTDCSVWGCEMMDIQFSCLGSRSSTSKRWRIKFAILPLMPYHYAIDALPLCYRCLVSFPKMPCCTLVLRRCFAWPQYDSPRFVWDRLGAFVLRRFVIIAGQ
jgi:hypothetical protein